MLYQLSYLPGVGFPACQPRFGGSEPDELAYPPPIGGQGCGSIPRPTGRRARVPAKRRVTGFRLKKPRHPSGRQRHDGPRFRPAASASALAARASTFPPSLPHSRQHMRAASAPPPAPMLILINTHVALRPRGHKSGRDRECRISSPQRPRIVLRAWLIGRVLADRFHYRHGTSAAPLHRGCPAEDAHLTNGEGKPSWL